MAIDMPFTRSAVPIIPLPGLSLPRFASRYAEV